MSYYMRKCKRPDKHEDDRLCFCPEAPWSPRQILSKTFINGWVNETWAAYAKKQAADETRPEADLWEDLFRLERAANDAYGMWRNTL